MTHKELIDRMDQGRLATTLVLQRLDLGLDPVTVIREVVGPTLSPVAVEAARRLVEHCAFHFAATALVLAGLADNSLLEVAEIPEPPARPSRPTPDDVAAEWLLRDLGAPATEAPTPTQEGDPHG